MGVFIILWLQGYIIIIRGGKRSQGLKKKCNQKCNQIIFFGYKVTNHLFHVAQPRSLDDVGQCGIVEVSLFMGLSILSM